MRGSKKVNQQSVPITTLVSKVTRPRTPTQPQNVSLGRIGRLGGPHNETNVPVSLRPSIRLILTIVNGHHGLRSAVVASYGWPKPPKSIIWGIMFGCFLWYLSTRDF